MDHMGEFGSDKEFQVGNIYYDGCCQTILNPYIYDFDSSSVKGTWSIGINSGNKQYKWGDYIPFDSTTQQFTTNGAVTTVYHNNTSNFSRYDKKNNIDKVLTVFHNLKNRDIFKIVQYYEDIDYPSQRDKYPWKMMFGYVKMTGKLYYEKIENNKIKTVYFDKVDITKINYTYCTFRSNIVNKYGTNVKINNFIKDGAITGNQKTTLYYYKKRTMQDSIYKQIAISGGGL